MTTREAYYQKLIDEDIAWVEKQPRTLERDHVITVLRWSVGQIYDGHGLTRNCGQCLASGKATPSNHWRSCVVRTCKFEAIACLAHGGEEEAIRVMKDHLQNFVHT